MDRLVLGLNTDHGDSSAALVSEKGILAAIAEERINRKKHCADFPALAIKEVLKIAGTDISDFTDIAVARDQNELYYDLIGRFKEITGVPVLLNTSFNENEPIVHTPAQAIDCFERTKMDALGIGPFWMEK